MSLLQVEHLSAGVGGSAVFAGLDLRIEAGDCVGLLGPNGTGKSTLLKALCGLVRPLVGEVRLGGRPIASMGSAERARQIALLPQDPPDDGDFTVSQVVQLGRHPYQRGFGWPSKEDETAVACAMEATGVAGLRTRCMRTLSGGERQRVRLAQALAQEPRLLLLDEPTTWTDLSYQVQLLAMLAPLARQKAIAIVVVLHDLTLASLFCDRLLLLHQGALVGNGPPSEVLTAARVETAFGLPVTIVPHPDTGAPTVLPRLGLGRPRGGV